MQIFFTLFVLKSVKISYIVNNQYCKIYLTLYI